MPPTPPVGAAGAAASAVEDLLAALVGELETAVVDGLEADYDSPCAEPEAVEPGLVAPGAAREPDARAQRLEAQRAARAAAFRTGVQDRFEAGGDAAALWALAAGDPDAQDRVLLTSAPELLAGLADADRELHRAAGRRFAMVAALAGPGTPAAGRRS
ncbi:MAG: hypothetical protein AB7V23_14810, partial [Candidatus Nanopelagicales bacterium]